MNLRLTLPIALLLAGCTPDQQLKAISIAAEALPCYQAVAAATQTGNTPTKVLTGANIAATVPACSMVTSDSLALIASAINAKAPVVAAPVSAPAAGVPAAVKP